MLYSQFAARVSSTVMRELEVVLSQLESVTSCDSVETAGKWRKCESYLVALTPWLADWAAHELGGSAPHQCR